MPASTGLPLLPDCGNEAQRSLWYREHMKIYPRTAEILHLLGASSLLALPTQANSPGRWWTS